jgi:hypothetical protein
LIGGSSEDCFFLKYNLHPIKPPKPAIAILPITIKAIAHPGNPFPPPFSITMFNGKVTVEKSLNATN